MVIVIGSGFIGFMLLVFFFEAVGALLAPLVGVLLAALIIFAMGSGMGENVEAGLWSVGFIGLSYLVSIVMGDKNDKTWLITWLVVSSLTYPVFYLFGLSPRIEGMWVVFIAWGILFALAYKMK